MEKELFFDGKKYISSKRAAKLTGYTHDYIGQLSRAGKVPGKLVGRTKFVEEDALLQYKKESDFLKKQTAQDRSVKFKSGRKVPLSLRSTKTYEPTNTISVESVGLSAGGSSSSSGEESQSPAGGGQSSRSSQSGERFDLEEQAEEASEAHKTEINENRAEIKSSLPRADRYGDTAKEASEEKQASSATNPRSNQRNISGTSIPSPFSKPQLVAALALFLILAGTAAASGYMPAQVKQAFEKTKQNVYTYTANSADVIAGLATEAAVKTEKTINATAHSSATVFENSSRFSSSTANKTANVFNSLRDAVADVSNAIVHAPAAISHTVQNTTQTIVDVPTHQFALSFDAPDMPELPSMTLPAVSPVEIYSLTAIAQNTTQTIQNALADDPSFQLHTSLQENIEKRTRRAEYELAYVGAAMQYRFFEMGADFGDFATWSVRRIALIPEYAITFFEIYIDGIDAFSQSVAQKELAYINGAKNTATTVFAFDEVTKNTKDQIAGIGGLFAQAGGALNVLEQSALSVFRTGQEWKDTIFALFDREHDSQQVVSDTTSEDGSQSQSSAEGEGAREERQGLEEERQRREKALPWERAEEASEEQAETRITERIVERQPLIVQSTGITEEELTRRLQETENELRSAIAQIQGSNSSNTIDTVYRTISQSQKIDNLSNVTISNATISGGLSGLTDDDIPDNITVSGVTSSQWTSTGSDIYFDSGNVGIGTTSPFTTFSVVGNGYIKGDLTINGNSQITEGGELTVGDKVISDGEIGVGTSSPYAKLAIQNTVATQTAFAIFGTSTQSAPLIDIFNNPAGNTNLFRLTASGLLGLGTTSPAAQLALSEELYVAGSATSTFDGNITVGGNLNFDGTLLQNDAPFVSSQWTVSGSDIYFNTGNVGIGTTSPYARLSVVGETVAEYFTATSTTATSTFGGVIQSGSGKFVSGVADSATAVAYSFDTENDLSTSGAKTFAVSRAGSEDFSIESTGIDGRVNLNIGSSAGTNRSVFIKMGENGNVSLERRNGLFIVNNSTQIDGFLRIAAAGGSTARHIFTISGDQTEPFTLTTADLDGDVNGIEIFPGDMSGDNPVHDTKLLGQAAYSDATTNLVGGPLVLSGGAGAANSAGAAHGGDVFIAGGYGYGTGDHGDVILTATSSGSQFIGNVGIGITSPSYQLHLQGDNTSGDIFLENSHGTINTNDVLGRVLFGGKDSASSVGAQIIAEATGGWNSGNDAESKLEFYTQSNGFSDGLNAPRMTIDDNGNVGIGTTSPWAKLSVESDGLGSDPAFAIGSSTQTDFVVTNGGNVGIGTTSPSFKLSINGDINLSGEYKIENVTVLRNNGAPESLYIGSSAGTGDNSTWGLNTYVGEGSAAGGNITSSSRYNTAVGYDTLRNITSGQTNVAIGTEAGKSAQSARANVYIGYKAGTAEVDGVDNVYIGQNTALAKTTGNQNTFVGADAGFRITGTSGTEANAFLGYATGYGITSGTDNAFIGGYAGVYQGSGNNNTYVGGHAGPQNIGITNDFHGTGDQNTFVGAHSGIYLTSGSNNTTSGFQSLYNITTGSNNVAAGMYALFAITTGSQNTVSGVEAGMRNAEGSNNTYVGYRAGKGVSGQTNSQNNVFLGYEAGVGNTTGSNNLLIGYRAGDSITSGTNNILIGYDIDAPDATGSSQLNIGNLIFGTGIDGTGTTLSSGNVGIGTTSPSSLLTVSANGAVSQIDTTGAGYAKLRFSESGAPRWGLEYSTDRDNIELFSHSLNTTALAIDDATGFVGIGSDYYNPAYRLDVSGIGRFTSLVDASHFVATSTTATSTFSGGLSAGGGAFTQYANGLTSIEQLELGPTSFGDDPGMVSWIDAGITSNSPSGTVHSYSAQLDANPIATVYGEADGSGGVQNLRFGVGTTSPWRSLSVNGTAAFTALTNDGTGYYACVNASTGELATSTTACGASSERFKTNIQDLTYGLDTINELRPVSFDWKESFIASGTPQIGLIAEEVATSVPEVIGYNSDGRITNLDYPKLVAVAINAIKELAKKVTDIKDTIAGFADQFTTRELCVADEAGNTTCLTKSQLDQLLGGGTVSGGGGSSSTGSGSLSSTGEDTTAPTITITGNNPAHVEVGSSYSDLGATVTDNEDDNLGIKAKVNGTDVGDQSNISIDTSTTSEHTIEYRATDQAGNTATKTRTVFVGEGGGNDSNQDTTETQNETGDAEEENVNTNTETNDEAEEDEQTEADESEEETQEENTEEANESDEEPEEGNVDTSEDETAVTTEE